MGDTTMAKSASARSGKSKAGSSSSRTRNVRKPSGSSLSEKRIRAKQTDTANMSELEAKATPIDWAKVDHTSDAEIARHMREDDTPSPSDREWRRMLNEGRVKLVTPEHVDVRAIRSKMNLSQSEFAARFGFTPSAVRQWEQGRRYPHGPARVLLTIIDREPNAVRRALDPEK
jgi:DNA-binding transcriptional regulator YiaG